MKAKLNLKSELFISVISPIYNEEKNIPLLYASIKDALDIPMLRWELILINDGSKDSSQEVIENIAQQDKRVKAICFRRNFGQTSAMMAGIDFSQGEVIVPIDADMQNDPHDIPSLLQKLEEGYDLCSGWRKDRKDNSLKRNLPSKIANKLISAVSGVHLHDYGCSLKAYKKDIVKSVRLYGEMHRFIPIYASWLGAKITEIPVSHNVRAFGKSNYGINRTIKVLLDLMVLQFLEKLSQKPIYLFGGVAILNFFFSMIFSLLMIYLKVIDGVSFSRTPLPIMFTLTTVVGVMFLLMGLMAEIQMRTWYESQGSKPYQIKTTLNIES
jgi:glycosyltransferase involved in cell wall biosynthesis